MLSSVFWWWRTKQSSFLYSRVLKGKLIFYYFCKRGNGTKEKQLVNKAASGTERRWVSFQNGKHPTMKQNHLRLSLNSCHCRQNAIWLAHTPQTAAPSIYYHGTSDDTGEAVTYCMGKRDWYTNRGEQFKLLAGWAVGGISSYSYKLTQIHTFRRRLTAIIHFTGQISRSKTRGKLLRDRYPAHVD